MKRTRDHLQTALLDLENAVLQFCNLPLLFSNTPSPCETELGAFDTAICFLEHIVRTSVYDIKQSDTYANITFTLPDKPGEGNTVSVNKLWSVSDLYTVFSGIVHTPFALESNSKLLSSENMSQLPETLFTDVLIVYNVEPLTFTLGEEKYTLSTFKSQFDLFKPELALYLKRKLQLSPESTFESVLNKMRQEAAGSQIIGKGNTGGCAFCPAFPCDIQHAFDLNNCVSKVFDTYERAKIEYDGCLVIQQYDTNAKLRFTAKALLCGKILSPLPVQYQLVCEQDARPQEYFQVIFEYGGISTSKAINLLRNDARTFAIALYPLFYGLNKLFEKGLFHTDLSHSNNIVYNVRSKSFVFIDFAFLIEPVLGQWSDSSDNTSFVRVDGTINVVKYQVYESFKLFLRYCCINPCKSLQKRSTFPEEKLRLTNLTDLFTSMLDEREFENISQGHDVYKTYLKDTYAYVPP